MKTRDVCSLSGSTFLVSNASGDILSVADGAVGLFFQDMRHLSSWRLLVDGKELRLLSCDDIEHYFTQHFLAPNTGTIYENPYLSVIRRRTIENGFSEKIELLNHGNSDSKIRLSLYFEADFKDLFEVKDQLTKKGRVYQKVNASSCTLGYQREAFVRETIIDCSEPCQFSDNSLELEIRLKAKESKTIELKVTPCVRVARDSLPQKNPRTDFKKWIQQVPMIETNLDAVRRLYRRSLVDLSALRFFPDPEHLPDDAIPAAGLPWFMAMFGRDSIITSYQALPFAPHLAKTTLRILASYQGTRVDAFRDEEPGKILHELRKGELTFFGERPQSPYYGSADSTPLFLILLDEYERWSGDTQLVRDLERHARKALDWIDDFGDRDGDGFVEYSRALESGLENQCWKDSGNSMLFANGTISRGPIATCEIQGYVYDAKMRCARLAKEIWGDDELAIRLYEDADLLQQKFNHEYWIEEKNHYALALDGNKNKVDSLTSNIGHLLWSGIVPNDRAELIAKHLMSPELFSGWGVRTMADGNAGYNPIEYHNGTVWPHDNSIIAAGLARYGYREEANRICDAMIRAAVFFNFRLPEVFAGYPESETKFPVEYPSASSPQAWSTGTSLLCFRVMLGLNPQGDELLSDPVLLPYLSQLSLTGIPGRWGLADITATRSNTISARDATWKWFDERADQMNKKKAA